MTEVRTLDESEIVTWEVVVERTGPSCCRIVHVTLGASQASVSYVLMLFAAASQYMALLRK